MEVNHDKDGVHLTYKNKKLIINGLNVLEGILSDEELLSFSKAILKFNQSLGRVSDRELVPEDLKINDSKDLKEIHNPLPFFKHVSEQDYQNYYSKGYFQLGSSKYYRDIEKLQSKDGFEGYSISILQVNNNQIPITLFTCNNYLIFCGTTQKSSISMKEKFGDVEIEIIDSLLFASEMAKSIGAIGFTIGSVEYSNAKISKSKQITTAQLLENDLFNSDEVMDLLLSTSLYPSLFVKPSMFEPEKEVRIVFEMPKEYTSCLRFYANDILKHINFNRH